MVLIRGSGLKRRTALWLVLRLDPALVGLRVSRRCRLVWGPIVGVLMHLLGTCRQLGLWLRALRMVCRTVRNLLVLRLLVRCLVVGRLAL